MCNVTIFPIKTRLKSVVVRGGRKLPRLLAPLFVRKPIGLRSLEGKRTVNPLRAKFFRENINIYLHFVSYLHIDTTQVVEILPQIRQEPAYAT